MLAAGVVSERVGRCVRIAGERLEPIIGAIAVAEGIIVCEGSCDLVVVEASVPSDVSDALGDAERCLAVSPRRLRSEARRGFSQAGASLVLDVEASVLDVAFACTELLFATVHEQRRATRDAPGLAVSFGDREGRLAGISRSGAIIRTQARVAEGEDLHMTVTLDGKDASLKGTVACAASDGVYVEFARGSADVAPRLYSLCALAS